MNDAGDPRPVLVRWLHPALSILIIAETLALLPLATFGLFWAGDWNGPINTFVVDVCALPVTLVSVMIVTHIYGDGVVLPSPVPSEAEQRRFRRELGGRPPMTDDEFYEQFYEGTSHPKSLVCVVRSLLIEYIDRRVARCRHDESLFSLIDVNEIEDLIWELESWFQIRSSDFAAGSADEPHPLNRTIDDWLCHVERHLSKATDEIDTASDGLALDER
jgi:hypothetical protein